MRAYLYNGRGPIEDKKAVKGGKIYHFINKMAIVQIAVASALVLVLFYVGWAHLTATKSRFPPRIYPLIGDDFQWYTTSQRPIRPFKGKKSHKITMGISDLSKTPEDWLLIEDTYKTVTETRRQITKDKPEQAVHVFDSPRTHLAVRELYDWITQYLTQRYPTIFIHTEKGIFNTIHKEYLPRQEDSTPRELVTALATHIEEDYVLLMKDDPTDKDEEYKLRSSLNGAPAGFDPTEGFNKPISAIHVPVPKYKERLQFSMHKFFNRLTPQDLWERHNWSIQTHNERFATRENYNHAYEGEEVREIAFDEVDFDNSSFLRVERQILTRMPVLGAIVMSVRTYLTPLKQIKAEGLGFELADAIDGLPEDLAWYKRRAAWGPATKMYLRDEKER